MSKFSTSLLSVLLLLSIFTVSLPQAGYAQTAAIVGAAPAAAPAQSDSDLEARLASIEEKVEKRRKELGIPGMSLVIVKDGQVIFMKGLGYKDFEKQAAVTPDTQFAIGSATKAFTALSALISADQGKLSLDDSPKKYLPYFKINNPDTDAKITVRDLLSHSSGLNRTDLAMITGKLNRQELIQVAGEAKPVAGLREKFMYQNIMFTAAGEVVAAVQKKPWEKFVPESIFAPLGMTNTTMSLKQMEKAKDYSFGYEYNFDTKETRRLPFRDIDEVAPAGSINSSARDMSQWLKFVLGGGSVGNGRLVSEKNFDEWLKPQMKIVGTSSYGLGWFLQEWNKLKVVQHGGNIDGFNSMVAMIPEKKIGFVMLTNVSASSLGGELMPIVWSGLLDEKKADQPKEPKETASYDKLAGSYRFEAAKMDIEIKIDGGKLVMTVPGQPIYTLERTGDRQYKMVGAPDGFAVKFTPAQGAATEMYLQQPQGNYTLPRINADGTLAKAAANGPGGTGSARELIGKYTAPGGAGAIEIKEDAGKVSMIVPGQQPYELKEKEKDVYNALPLPDSYLLKAKRSANGKVESVVMVQPEGEFTFTLAGGAEASAPMITVDDLMAKTIVAAGGEANLRKVTSRVSTFEMDLENQGVKGFGKMYAKAPNRSATDTTMTALGKKIAVGYDYFDGTGGEELYSFAPAEKYSGKRLEDIRLGSDFYSALDWKANYKKIEVSRTEKVGDEECFVVTFEPEKGTKFNEYYSTKSFLLLKRTGVVTSSTSDMQIPYSVTFSDYRDVDGIKIAFKIVNSSISNGTITTTLKDVKHNVEIKDDVFKMKKL